MKYPRWFPFPKCWLKALILEVSLIPLAIVIQIFGTYTLFFIAILWNFNSWCFFLWLFVFGAMIPFFFLGHIYQWLWGEPDQRFPKWIPSLRSWGEAAWGWFVSLVSIAISWQIVMMLSNSRYQYNTISRLSHEQINICVVLFLIISAYLYHSRVLFVEWFKNKVQQ